MSSTKRTTIFRQLMLSVMVPVIFLIALISVLNFYEKKSDITESRKETISLIHDEIEELLTFFDLTLVEIEKEMGKEGERFAKILAEEVFPNSENIETINMDSVRAAVGMNEGQDIYIIDTNATIINTTYDPDLGLNFLSISDFFIEHFAKIREAQTFVEDRISIEMTTKKPKKYMYRATQDKKYIIEFGFYSDPATALVEHFISKLDSLPNKYEGIDTVSLYFGTNGFKSYQGHVVPQRDSIIANQTLMTGEPTSNTLEANGLIYTSDYSLITMEESILHTGYVLRIIHNDGLVRELVKQELKGFLINLLIFVVPIFALILWRARVLSKPISNLVSTMNQVQSGDLQQRAIVSGNNEVTELGEHFNSMISELQESYATLEQKVEDRTRELREQKHMVEEAHKEITDSIKYAKRLQDAILPPIALVQNYLPESFILFKPKDVVSGDFYWFETVASRASATVKNDAAAALNTSGSRVPEALEGTLLLAAADCTGHGVPGAMVSVVCSNALHRTVNEFGITEPAKILDKTRSLVIETFAKSDREVKDGMDISLVSLRRQPDGKMHITWCGANNPLWLVKRLENLTEAEKNDPDLLFGEGAVMIELKPNKQPVGLYAGMKDFQQQELVLSPGDLFYLFTDGYADQFGGDKGKKMKYKPFKEKLLELSRVDLSAQREILATNFVNWRGDFEQIDDVCVIGVRV
jgi:phosphoserine phosphatase RsbU/P